MRIDPAPSVDAPLVFAGHGLQIPEAKHDDFAGLDVKGKVVVYLAGSPKEVPGALSAHYQSAAERWSTLKRLGAIGVISIANPKAMDVPWERSSPNRLNAAMALADAVARRYRRPAGFDRLQSGEGRTPLRRIRSHVRRAACRLPTQGKALPHFPLPLSVRAKVKVDSQDVESHNVAGMVKGSDPALAERIRRPHGAPRPRRRRRPDQR